MRHSMRCCWPQAALESYLRTGQQIDTIPVNIGAIPTSYSMFGKEVDTVTVFCRTNQTALYEPQSTHKATGSCLLTQ
jgi:hypothetical protein